MLYKNSGLNKNIIIALFLLCVFIVGTISLVDTVEAAKWKKSDSGTFNVKKADSGYKKKMQYISYKKGSNNIKMELYGYKTKKNKKELVQTLYYTKSGDKIKYYSVNKKGKKSKTQTTKVNMTLKNFQKNSLAALKNLTSGNNSKNVSSASKLQYKYVYDYGYHFGLHYVLDLVLRYDSYYGEYRYRYEYVWKYGYEWGYEWVWKWV